MVGKSCTTIHRMIVPSRRVWAALCRAPAVGRSGLGVFLAMVLCLTACAPRTKDRIALVGGNVITGAGDPVLRDAVVVVHAGHIETVAPREGFKIPKSAVTVDVTGGWIIPGLIDGHAHVERWALARYVAAGVTTARDVGGQQDSMLGLREEVSLGGIVAPRIFSAGAMLDGAPAIGPDASEVTNADQVRKAVDKLAVGGADYVKAYTRITPALFKPLMDEAATFDLRVTAHLGLTDALTAVKLGVSSIEHLSGIPEALARNPEKLYAEHRASFFRGWNAFERAWVDLDSVALTQLAITLAQERVVMIPTLVLHETFSRLDQADNLHPEDLRTLPDSQMQVWNVPGMIARAGWTTADYVAFRAARHNQDLFLRAFRGAGGRISAGTDASNQMLVPGWGLHTELELLVAAGLTPSDALKTATINTAELLGADSLGIIAPGKVADLVVLKQNPLLDIRNTRGVLHVMVRGQLYQPDSLRSGF